MKMKRWQRSSKTVEEMHFWKYKYKKVLKEEVRINEGWTKGEKT